MTDHIEFHGESYELAEKLGLMPLMRFAKVAQDGVDSADMEGLAAMYDLVEQCFTDEAWARFQVAATKHHADDEDLLDVVQKAIEIMAARPTRRSAGSLAGPQTTRSSSPTVLGREGTADLDWALAQYGPSERFPKGRPDLAVGVVDRWEALHPGEPLPQLRAV